jgi:predicted ATP-binding protein involved in virulence
MNNKQRILKSFSIKKLFGTTDVMIPFEDTAKILIGVNGLGKTQVLNMLYCALTQKNEKLIEYVFDSFTIEFGDNSKASIYKSDIKKRLTDHPIIKTIVEQIGITQFLQLYNIASNAKDISFALRVYPSARRIIENSNVTVRMIEEAVKVMEMTEFDKKESLSTYNSKKNQELIENHLKSYEILYFPTYRRIEEDFRNWGYDETKFGINDEDNRLLHFSMEDVKKRFITVTQSIDKLSKDGFAKISSEILSQFVEGLPIIDKNVLNSINSNDIDIILARVGNQLTVGDKNRIQKMVFNKEIQEKDYYLVYFLQKLVSIYKQQRVLDQSIKKFRDTCNKYLINKKLIYEESSVEIYIQLEQNSDRLALDQLSLGEKQIISIFSKIYLAPNESRFIVLFDEPELSIAIDWQQNLLPDILKSGKCDFLLAATHSPFIFDNDLDKYAIGLNMYFKPSKPLAA